MDGVEMEDQMEMGWKQGMEGEWDRRGMRWDGRGMGWVMGWEMVP